MNRDRMSTLLRIIVFSTVFIYPQNALSNNNSEHEVTHKISSTVNKNEKISFSVKEKNLTIFQLIEYAIKDNPETLSKRALLKSAESSVDAALQQFFPSPYAQVINNEGSSKVGGNFNQRIGVIGIQQPLWTGGKLTANLNIAKSAASSADFSIQETQLSLALRVVDAYQGLLQYHGRIQTQIKNINILYKYAEIMTRRVQNGASAQSDEALVAARISQAQSDLESYKAAQRTLLEHLIQLTGRPLELDNIEYEVAGSLSNPAGSDEMIAKAIQVNPTLRRIYSDLEIIKHEEEQQQAVLMPTLSLKAESRDDLFRDDSSGLDSARENIVYATLEFSPGAGLSSFANIESAKTKTLAQQKMIETNRRELNTKIIKEYEDCHSSLIREEMLKRTVRSSQEVLASYDRLFTVGKRSWLDVLNAARDLMQPEIALADNLALNRASAHRLRLYTTDLTQAKETDRTKEAPPPDNTLSLPTDNAKESPPVGNETSMPEEYDSCIGKLCNKKPPSDKAKDALPIGSMEKTPVAASETKMTAEYASCIGILCNINDAKNTINTAIY